MDFLVYTSSAKAYYVQVAKNETVSWNSEANAARSNSSFTSIRRFGINQLIGYGSNFIYDFQTRTSYNGFSNIGKVYLTDNGDSRDYMLVLRSSDNKIYSSEPNMGLSFSDVSNSNITLSKTDGNLFVIDWTHNQVYMEDASGALQLIASGLAFNDEDAIDGQVCNVDRNNYLCVMRSSDVTDIYLLDSDATPSIRLVKTYQSTSTDGYFSRIRFQLGSSGFRRYVRYTLFESNAENWNYCWPIIGQPDNYGEFIYLDQAAQAQLIFSGTGVVFGSADTYRRIGKTGDILYGVKPNGSNIWDLTVKELPSGPEFTGIGSSKNAWRIGNRYFGQKDSGCKYYNGKVWSDFGNDETFIDIVGKADSRYYLLDSDKNLYVAVGLPVHPLYTGRIPLTRLAEDGFGGASPARLVSGRKYAGAICQIGSGIQQLYILWPDGNPSSRTTSDDPNYGSVDSSTDYDVSPVLAVFVDFPDGGANTKQIVPLGDFLDEIVVYEGGFLHIARVSDGLLIQDATGKSQIPVTTTMPYTGFAETFASGINASAKNGGTRYVAGERGLSSF